MRIPPQIPAYLAGAVIGHWIGSGTEFHPFALLGGLILGIVFAGLIGKLEQNRSRDSEASLSLGSQQQRGV